MGGGMRIVCEQVGINMMLHGCHYINADNLQVLDAEGATVCTLSKLGAMHAGAGYLGERLFGRDRSYITLQIIPDTGEEPVNVRVSKNELTQFYLTTDAVPQKDYPCIVENFTNQRGQKPVIHVQMPDYLDLRNPDTPVVDIINKKLLEALQQNPVHHTDGEIYAVRSAEDFTMRPSGGGFAFVRLSEACKTPESGHGKFTKACRSTPK
jgi:hypothetical protein